MYERDKFEIIEVGDEASESIEFLGSKEKFWFTHSEFGKCLFKVTRQNTGEDWAEKIAAEIAQFLDMPHAEYHLGTWRDKKGVVSPIFATEKEYSLVHGNELLSGALADYPEKGPRYGFRKYTLNAVMRVLQKRSLRLSAEWSEHEFVEGSVDLFVGYLLLDALIGNTDRHHENWGVLESNDPGSPEAFLAPTFDHASSLGRNESDKRRRERLQTNDRNFSVEGYADRARSAFFDENGNKLLVDEVYRETFRRRPAAAAGWLNRLQALDDESIDSIVRRIPSERMSEEAVRFCIRMLRYNRERLLGMRN